MLKVASYALAVYHLYEATMGAPLTDPKPDHQTLILSTPQPVPAEDLWSDRPRKVDYWTLDYA